MTLKYRHDEAGPTGNGRIKIRDFGWGDDMFDTSDITADIRVNCVSPGPTDTPLMAAVPDKVKEALTKAIPLRRLGRPEEVADAVLFFAGDGASYVTGQVLSVSGGLTMVG